jgi:ABC-type transport system involved in cytochrome bd biosynthesis fused ATPase/permease subunit
MAGYHLTNRAELVEEAQERSVHMIIPSPAKLRARGELIHFDGVNLKYKSAPKPLLDNVTFTVGEGARVAFVGAVGGLLPNVGWTLIAWL